MSKSYYAHSVVIDGKTCLTVFEIENGNIGGSTIVTTCDGFQMQGSTIMIQEGEGKSVFDCATGSYLFSV